jgi:DNA primase
MELFKTIKQAVRLLPEIESRIALKKEGSSYKGCCPFHSDTSPSFSIKGDEEFWKCFGCGASGDVVSFVERFDGLTPLTAAKKLAQKYGIPIEQENAHNQPSGNLPTLRLLADHWHKRLMDNATGVPAKRYLQGRGFGKEHAAWIKDFKLGYCDAQTLPQLAAQLQIPEEGLQGIGITGDNGNLMFANRLIIPVCDKLGNCIAFAGRTIADNGKPKYINSPETEHYKKDSVLYGLSHAYSAINKSKAVIVAEGYFDVQACHFAKMKQVVGLCGTSLHPNQIHQFPCATKWVLMLDGDSAGQTATKRSILTLLEQGISSIEVWKLSEGKDPYSILQEADWVWGDKATANIKSTHFIKFLNSCPDDGEDTLELILTTIAKSKNLFSREKVLQALTEYSNHSFLALMGRLNELIEANCRKTSRF